MREVIAVLVVLLVAGALARWRPLPDREPPQPLPAASCQTWMADAIPGVGPKSREQVAAAISSGQVPAKATDWFVR